MGLTVYLAIKKQYLLDISTLSCISYISFGAVSCSNIFILFQLENVLTFSYNPPPETENVGKANLTFTVTQHLWDMLIIDDLIHDDQISAYNLVFVLAASTNHFNESMDTVGSIQLYMPQHRIFYYDIEIPSMDEHLVTKVLCQWGFTPFLILL